MVAYTFPDWVDVGVHVLTEDGNEWVITDTYVTGSYNSDWGMLVLEHASVIGVEATVKVSEVTLK